VVEVSDQWSGLVVLVSGSGQGLGFILLVLDSGSD
jgi:hypothetical protein